MGKLWSIVEDWRDAMEFPPSYRQIAIRMGVSQSTFDTWKKPQSMPDRKNLYAIHLLTSRPFASVVQAAIDDVGLFDEVAARREHEDFMQGLAQFRAADEKRRADAKYKDLRQRADHRDWRRGILSEQDDRVAPAADRVDPDADESPGGSR